MPKFRLLLFLMIPWLQAWGQNDSILFKNNVINITRNTARYGSNVLYDAKAELIELMEDEPCARFTKILYTPLSLTGTIYAFEKAIVENGSNECGNPASNGEIVVIDASTQKTVNILDLVEESSLLSALKNDAWVKKLDIPETIMTSCTTVHKLLATIEYHSSDGAENPFTPHQFAILKYDEKNNKVAIRLIKKEYNGFNHYKFIQLGLWATPNQAFRNQLKTQSGFFVGKFRGGILNP